MSYATRHAARRALVLESRARQLRARATPSEAAFWAALRKAALPVAFKRQVPLLGHFIADFFAPAAGVVVEVDGGVPEQRRARDARRDEKLRRAGYRVLRLPAELVLRVELIRFPGRVDKHYATSDFSLQASNEVGVS